MGFDLGMYEQVIWNTAHGRWFATSNFKYTDIHLGADVILMEALVALPYTLFPTTYTLLFLETVAVASGVIPLYLLAKRRLGMLAALGICFAYLIYVPLHFLNLYEFQPRAFAISLVFLLFYALEIQSRRWFLVAAGPLLTTRSDVALLLIMVGVFALIHRKPRNLSFGRSDWALHGLRWRFLSSCPISIAAAGSNIWNGIVIWAARRVKCSLPSSRVLSLSCRMSLLRQK